MEHTSLKLTLWIIGMAGVSAGIYPFITGSTSENLGISISSIVCGVSLIAGAAVFYNSPKEQS